jgi:precorrin-6B methylase 2
MRSLVPRPLLLAFVLGAFAASAVAQTPPASPAPSAQTPETATPFEPSVGQPGKDVVWVPTSDALVAKMLDLAKVTPADFVVDLGSGDGRTVIAAAKRGARAVGIEYNADMVALSKRNAAEQQVANRATFLTGDLFEADLSRATVITMFLLPDINLKLRPSLLDLKPGTRIVSNTFSMEEWEADEIVTLPDDECASWCRALLWIVPARVGGTWRIGTSELTLTQEFQVVRGELKNGATSAPVENGKLQGNQITFTVAGTTYTGRVTATGMGGTASGTSRAIATGMRGTSSGATSGAWTARRTAS